MKEKNNTVICLRIPRSSKKEIDKVCQAKNITQSEFIRAAIDRLLDTINKKL